MCAIRSYGNYTGRETRVLSEWLKNCILVLAGTRDFDSHKASSRAVGLTSHSSAEFKNAVLFVPLQYGIE
jgi:hypothetical protein